MPQPVPIALSLKASWPRDIRQYNENEPHVNQSIKNENEPLYTVTNHLFGD